MATLYWACAEVLLEAVRLGTAREPSPCDHLKRDVLAKLRTMVSIARAQGVSDAEIAEARYAMVAFIDERVLQSNWPGRTEWRNHPLQLQLYGENSAGENFFARMDTLLARREPSPALEIYYLCLVLGFAGALAATPQGARKGRAYVDRARSRLGRASGPVAPPVTPDVRTRGGPTHRPFLLLLALGCAALALLGTVVMRWSLLGTIQTTRAELTAGDTPEWAATSAAR